MRRWVYRCFFIIVSGLIDELWARQEKKKAFNWLCWLDGFVVGWMAGTAIDYLRFLQSSASAYTLHRFLIGGIAGGALLLSLSLEIIRPYRPYAWKPVTHDTPFSEGELARQIKENAAFLYWDSQSPFWVTLLAVLLPLVFIGVAAGVWASAGWGAFTLVFFGLSALITIGMVAFAYGGQRILVTRQELDVRWGSAGIKVLHLNTANITDTALMEFAPFRDFGGYGIRYGKGMKAYFFRGNRGIVLTTMNGKKYLVGSDHPERLLNILQMVRGRK